MSPQIIEVLIFAGIAFFVINKLISILGTTDDDSPEFKESKFGEPTGLRDVTNSEVYPNSFSISNLIQNSKIDYSTLVDPNDEHLKKSLSEVADRIYKFNPVKFLSNASKAWQMIISSIKKDDFDLLETLIDPRYQSEFQEKKSMYSKVDSRKVPELKISDITIFGNNVIIKVIVNITGMDQEEWAFSRNTNSDSPNWYLSNIEKFYQ